MCIYSNLPPGFALRELFSSTEMHTQQTVPGQTLQQVTRDSIICTIYIQRRGALAQQCSRQTSISPWCSPSRDMAVRRWFMIGFALVLCLYVLRVLCKWTSDILLSSTPRRRHDANACLYYLRRYAICVCVCFFRSHTRTVLKLMLILAAKWRRRI